jgi:hypothetical protein
VALIFLYLAIVLSVAFVLVCVIWMRRLVRDKQKLSKGEYTLFIGLCLSVIACCFAYAALS